MLTENKRFSQEKKKKKINALSIHPQQGFSFSFYGWLGQSCHLNDLVYTALASNWLRFVNLPTNPWNTAFLHSTVPPPFLTHHSITASTRKDKLVVTLPAKMCPSPNILSFIICCWWHCFINSFALISFPQSHVPTLPMALPLNHLILINHNEWIPWLCWLDFVFFFFFKSPIPHVDLQFF